MRKVKQGIETVSILEKEYVYLHSLLREREHFRAFKSAPQTIHNIPPLTQLHAFPENARILSVLSELRKDPHSFFPRVIDHWTSFENLKSILSENALMGNYALKRARINFEGNVLCKDDEDNLDGNVICFSPGNFVDPFVFYDKNFALPSVRNDRVLIRLNIERFEKKGRFNSFFKITDLYGPYFTKEIAVSPGFNITISRNMNNTCGYNLFGEDYPISVNFDFLGQKETISFTINESLFYGNISEINYFCLLLLFKALEKCKKQDLVKSIYGYINELDKVAIENLLIQFAKSITPISEYNIRGILEFVPKIIHEIHLASECKTYCFSEYNDQEYILALEKIVSLQSRKELSSRSEKIIPKRSEFNENSICEIYGERLLYNGQKCNPRYMFSRTELKDELPESVSKMKLR